MRAASGVMGRVALLLLVAAASGAVVRDSSGEPRSTTGSARAVAVSIAVPAASPIEGGVVSSFSNPQASGSFTYPEDASVVSIASYSASASGADGGSISQGVVDIPEAVLFGGEIVITGIAARARAHAPSAAVVADANGSQVASVTVSGQPLPVTNGVPLPIGDWGSLVVVAVESVGAEKKKRVAVTTVRLTLTAEHRGLAAGTEIVLGNATSELEIAAPPQPPPPPPTTPAETTPPKRRTLPAVPKPTPAKPSQRPDGQNGLPGPPEIDVKPQLTKQGYVFPIFGQAWFSSTFGAARANTGWHHGTDIFAAFGVPVLAVADGTLFSVGWNKVGGFRLWLRDRQGNQFYYAHMAGYSPIATEGREVKAGQVIGFNGNTGDAQGTPYHVHFEVHPVSLLPLGYDGVVDPYPFLLAWRRLQDVALSAGTAWAPPVPVTARAPLPAVVLLQAVDISMASGLDPGALDRAAAGLSPTGQSTFFDPAVPCAECDGRRP